MTNEEFDGAAAALQPIVALIRAQMGRENGESGAGVDVPELQQRATLVLTRREVLSSHHWLKDYTPKLEPQADNSGFS